MLGPRSRRGSAYKTKLCALWQRGRCSRVSCDFAHGDAELRRLPSHSSFHPRPAQCCGRRDYRNHDLRDRLERRYSPYWRHSPGRDTSVHHSFHDLRPSSRERGSSYSRSPIRKSERRQREKLDDGETKSSGSPNISDTEDRKKNCKFSSDDEKDDIEAQLKQIQLDMEALCDDKSLLEVILDQRTDEALKISSRIDDLGSQLNKEEEECRRMTSKTKKFIKAHGRYMKAQEDLKRSQARFERLADLLASDTLKPGANEEGSTANASAAEDPHGAYESGQQHNHVSATRKRSVLFSTREEAKTGKKRRERDYDMVPESEKYRLEDALESDKNSKETETPKSSYVNKKVEENNKNMEGNVLSSSNIFTDKFEGNDEEVGVE